MGLKVDSTLDIDSTLLLLQEKYPDLKIKKSGKRAIIILNGKIAAVVKFRKKGTTVHGDLNLNDAMNMTFFVLGVVFGIIGLLILFPVLWISLNKKIKSFKTEVYNVLNN